jgi:hypothetical protein
MRLLTVRASTTSFDLHAWRPGTLTTTCGIPAQEVTRTGYDWPPGLEVDGLVCPVCMVTKRHRFRKQWWRGKRPTSQA